MKLVLLFALVVSPVYADLMSYAQVSAGGLVHCVGPSYSAMLGTTSASAGIDCTGGPPGVDGPPALGNIQVTTGYGLQSMSFWLFAWADNFDLYGSSAYTDSIWLGGQHGLGTVALDFVVDPSCDSGACNYHTLTFSVNGNLWDLNGAPGEHLLYTSGLVPLDQAFLFGADLEVYADEGLSQFDIAVVLNSISVFDENGNPVSAGAAVPEPSAFSLLALLLAGLGGAAARHRWTSRDK